MVYGGSNGFPFSRFKGGRRELYKSQHRETAWIRKNKKGTSLAVQWLRLCNSTAGGTGSIPGWGTNILHSHAVQWGKKIIQGESKINMCLLAVQIKSLFFSIFPFIILLFGGKYLYISHKCFITKCDIIGNSLKTWELSLVCRVIVSYNKKHM